MNIDVCFSPALYDSLSGVESVVVVVDVFRATTTIATAFMNGVKSIRPVATVEEALMYKSAGFLVGAERNVRRCEFADFGNSPFDYTREAVAGKDIVLTTTNGTRAVDVAKGAYGLIAGAFVNIHAVADYCLAAGKDVIVLAAGWKDRVNIEDILFGGALADYLLVHSSCRLSTDAARIALDLWNLYKNDLRMYIEQSEHYSRLLENGLDGSVDYCLSIDIAPVVPVLSSIEGVFTID